MIRKTILSVVLVIGILAAGLVVKATLAALRKEPNRATRPVRIPRVFAPPIDVKTNYPVKIEGYGSAEAKTRIGIAPKVAGEVVWVSPNFESGRIVRAHPDNTDVPAEVLFRIEPDRYQIAVDAAQENIALLQAKLDSLQQKQKNLQANERIQQKALTLDKNQLERTQALKAKGVSTENEVDQAMRQVVQGSAALQNIQNELALIEFQRAELKAELASANVRLREAKLNLSYTTYRAPVTGRVIDCRIEEGDYVAVGQVCGEMYGMEEMEIPVSVPASDLQWLPDPERPDAMDVNGNASKVVPADVVWVERGTGREIHWQGRLDRIEAGLEARSRTARMVIAVNNQQVNPDGPVIPLDLNMYCKVEVRGKTIPKAFLLPREAIHRKQYVYLANEDNGAPRLTERKVDVARFTDETAMILPDGGLDSGDRVIRSMVPKPVMGMALQLQDAPAAASTTSPTAPTTNASVED
jgi:multidrug efflux pump subunit AcrA (membrane-fusion protein)